MRLYLGTITLLAARRRDRPGGVMFPGDNEVNERFKPVAAVAGLLFAVYTLGWFVHWLARHHPGVQDAVGIAEIALIAAVVGVTMFRWSARKPLVEAMPPLVVAVAIGCAISVLLSPFAGGSYPFKAGAGDFFFKVWIFLGASLAGMLLGYLVLVALGRDHRSRALDRMARARPTVTGRPNARQRQKQGAKSRSDVAQH